MKIQVSSSHTINYVFSQYISGNTTHTHIHTGMERVKKIIIITQIRTCLAVSLSLHISTYLPTYVPLHPWSRGLPDKLTGSQLGKKFPVFCGSRKFIIAFTKVHRLYFIHQSLPGLRQRKLHILPRHCISMCCLIIKIKRDFFSFTAATDLSVS
jgi:hypothetical protein